MSKGLNKHIIQLLEEIDWDTAEDESYEEIFRYMKELVQGVRPARKREEVMEAFANYLDGEDVLKYLRQLIRRPGRFESATDTIAYVKDVLEDASKDVNLFYRNLDGILFDIRLLDLKELHEEILYQLKRD